MKTTKSVGLRRGLPSHRQAPLLIFVSAAVWLGSLGLFEPCLLFGETFSRTNSAEINIIDNAPSSLYPSVISVAGLTQLVSHITVTVWGLEHTFSSDISMLLVGPQGQGVVLMSVVGDTNNVGVSVNRLTFDDSAAAFLPVACADCQITNGTYRPTDGAIDDFYYPPAPGGPYQFALSDFSGTNPNGTWSLYVEDTAADDFGFITNGWSLNIVTAPFVQQLVPVITWDDPADIVYGTPLGASQLNATANASGVAVPGSYTYSPSAGSVLPAGGSQTLSVTFEPTDTTHYLPATATVSINVLKAPLTVTAEDKSRVYSAPNPALTARYSGFVGGDNTNVVSGSPDLSPRADTNSPVGSYVITAAAGSLSVSNYSLIFSNGTLTITAASSTNTLSSSQNPSLLHSNVTFTATVTPIAPATAVPTGNLLFLANGALFGSPVPLTSGTASFSTALLPASSNAVTAEYAGDGNFFGSTNSVVLVVFTNLALPTRIVDPMINTNGIFEFTVTGELTGTLRVECSDDLRNWAALDLAPVLQLPALLRDDRPAASEHRYYRIVVAP